MGDKQNFDHNGWQKQKMKLKFVAQTFSVSVADSLEFLEQDLKDTKFKVFSST